MTFHIETNHYNIQELKSTRFKAEISLKYKAEEREKEKDIKRMSQNRQVNDILLKLPSVNPACYTIESSDKDYPECNGDMTILQLTMMINLHFQLDLESTKIEAAQKFSEEFV